MSHISATTSGRHGSTDVEAVAFWIFAGIIMAIAFGDALTVLALAIAVLAAISWVYGKFARRWSRNAAKIAPVNLVRPEVTHGSDQNRTSADPSVMIRPALARCA
jgi:cbb3-type cytochrome oxidase subunit 3